MTPDLFRPSLPRGWMAVLIAAVAFFIPQEIPLEYYPLNNPGTDINYLEIACASDKLGEVQIFYDLTKGINELHSIRFPIGPSEQSFTYTFPLPDAPIISMRLDPPGDGATFFIRQMRIINRRNEEIHRFTRWNLLPIQQIENIQQAPTEGWTILSAPGANDPYALLKFSRPLVPVGMDHRNLLRCLLSTGYLSLMLWIILLAVFFAFYRPYGEQKLWKYLGFLAFLSVIFAVVGNRGLIRNSVHYARFQPPAPLNSRALEFEVEVGKAGIAQLFWDIGKGYNEEDSDRAGYDGSTGLQTLHFKLPSARVASLRFDPMNSAGEMKIHGMTLTDAYGEQRISLSTQSLTAANEIARMESQADAVLVETTSSATDPMLSLGPDLVTAVNATLNQPNK